MFRWTRDLLHWALCWRGSPTRCVSLRTLNSMFCRVLLHTGSGDSVIRTHRVTSLKCGKEKDSCASCSCAWFLLFIVWHHYSVRREMWFWVGSINVTKAVECYPTSQICSKAHGTIEIPPSRLVMGWNCSPVLHWHCSMLSKEFRYAGSLRGVCKKLLETWCMSPDSVTRSHSFGRRMPLIFATWEINRVY